MVILALHTAETPGGAAVARGETVLAEAHLARPRSEGGHFVPLLAQLLRGVGLGPEAVELLVVVTGPGSHTGLRIGLMAARTLAWALGRPVVGVTTLEALLRQAEGVPAAPVVGAGRRGLYGGLWDGEGWRLPPGLYPPATLAAALPPGTRVVGSGGRRLRRLPGAESWVFPPPDRETLQPGTVARAGYGRRDAAGPPEALRLTYFPAAAARD